VRTRVILIGSAVFAALLGVFACGLDVEGSNDPVTGPEASTTDARDSTSPFSIDGGSDAPIDTGAPDADASEPLTGFCANFPTAFLCDDFDRGNLSKWDGIQTSNGNTLALSMAQSKTAPSSVLVTTFDSPDSGTAMTCDRAALYKIFTLDFQEAEVSFDFYPTSASSRAVAATLFMSDLVSGTYRIEVAVGQNAFIEESETSAAPVQTPFTGDLVPNSWTRVKIRYSRTPSKLTVLYDNAIKHEKALASTSYSTNHRLYIGAFCSREAKTFHIDNVVFEKTR
jgi:hypothetical protein